MLGFGWWEMDGESPRCPGVNHERPKKTVWSSDLAFGLPFQDARRPSMKNSASVTGTHGKRPVHLSRAVSGEWEPPNPNRFCSCQHLTTGVQAQARA